ncbi:MAG: pantoate--beta-alanine ligase [Firmicutes bacterium]|nr:pantoate--beta-alanine ligase [Bacillota bacterium]MDY6173850.1 pantoate--beta-alanine ligase [Lentihominibacter sp.]
MIIANTISQVRDQVRQWRREGLTVGLVPTMGYLHEGHGSLVGKAAEDCDRVVASVFVNPTQFAPGEDLASYPRDFERDCEILEKQGCSMVFHPSVDEMYPDGNGKTDTYIEILNDMPKQLCGRTRPNHFRGVCTIVGKLFNIVLPDKAYFGEKDAQQLAIIRRMVRDLSYGIEIVGCPIVREPDGLAKSSRNIHLKPDERKAAVALYRSLKIAEEMASDGEKSSKTVTDAVRAEIEKEPLAEVEYVSAVDSLSMEPVETVGKDTLIAIAVRIGQTRLIDNCVLNTI